MLSLDYFILFNKANINFPLCLIRHNFMKKYGSGGIGPKMITLTLDVSESSASLLSAPLLVGKELPVFTGEEVEPTAVLNTGEDKISAPGGNPTQIPQSPIL
jgi:hypothetical protein